MLGLHQGEVDEYTNSHLGHRVDLQGCNDGVRLSKADGQDSGLRQATYRWNRARGRVFLTYTRSFRRSSRRWEGGNKEIEAGGDARVAARMVELSSS
jgi:hypothetical protein